MKVIYGDYNGVVDLIDTTGKGSYFANIDCVHVDDEDTGFMIQAEFTMEQKKEYDLYDGKEIRLAIASDQEAKGIEAEVYLDLLENVVDVKIAILEEVSI